MHSSTNIKTISGISPDNFYNKRIKIIKEHHNTIYNWHDNNETQNVDVLRRVSNSKPAISAIDNNSGEFIINYSTLIVEPTRLCDIFITLPVTISKSIKLTNSTGINAQFRFEELMQKPFYLMDMFKFVDIRLNDTIIEQTSYRNPVEVLKRQTQLAARQLGHDELFKLRWCGMPCTTKFAFATGFGSDNQSYAGLSLIIMPRPYNLLQHCNLAYNSFGQQRDITITIPLFLFNDAFFSKQYVSNVKLDMVLGGLKTFSTNTLTTPTIKRAVMTISINNPLNKNTSITMVSTHFNAATVENIRKTPVRIMGQKLKTLHVREYDADPYVGYDFEANIPWNGKIPSAFIFINYSFDEVVIPLTIGPLGTDLILASFIDNIPRITKFAIHTPTALYVNYYEKSHTTISTSRSQYGDGWSDRNRLYIQTTNGSVRMFNDNYLYPLPKKFEFSSAPNNIPMELVSEFKIVFEAGVFRQNPSSKLLILYPEQYFYTIGENNTVYEIKDTNIIIPETNEQKRKLSTALSFLELFTSNKRK